MLKLQKVSLQNFQSYGSKKQTIDFTDKQNDLILIYSNKNGVGKTSIFDAIYFALFGDAFQGKKDELINNINCKNLMVEVELYDSISKHNYRIVRQLKPNRNYLYLDNKEEPEDLGQYKSDFDGYITKLLKLDKLFFKKFINNNILMSMNFLSSRAGEKQKIFEFLFELEKILKLRKYYNDLKSTKSDKHNELNRSINSSEEKIDGLTKHLKDLRTSSHNYDKTITDMKNHMSVHNSKKITEIENIQTKINKIYSKIEKEKGLWKDVPEDPTIKIKEIENYINKLSYEDSNIKDRLKKLESKKSNLISILGISDNIENIHIKMKEINNECKTNECIYKKLDVLSELTTSDDEIKRIKERIDIIKTETKTNNKQLDSLELDLKKFKEYKNSLDTITDYEKDITNLTEEINKIKNSDKDVESNYKSVIEDSVKMLKETLINIENVEKDLKDLTINLKTLKKENDQLSQEIKWLSFLLNEVMENNQIVKRVIDSNLSAIEYYVNYFLKKYEFSQSLKLSYNDDLELKFSNGQSLEKFSAGEQLRIKLSFVFAFIIFLKGINKNHLDILTFDELLESSSDEEGIDQTFKIFDDLKKNMMICVISHGMKTIDKFSRVIEITKGVFSEIHEIVN